MTRLLLIAMKLDKSPEYNAKIDKIQSFVAQLPTYAYLSDSVLNINLLDYLGKHTNIERERFLLFMARLEQPVAKMVFWPNITKRENKIIMCLITISIGTSMIAGLRY